MSFLKHSSQMLGWRALGIAVSTVNVVLLARWLGPEDRGELAIIVLSLTLAALVIQFGLPQAIVHLISAGAHSEKEISSTVIAYLGGLSMALAIAAHWSLTHLWFTELNASLLIPATVVLVVLVTTLRHVFLARSEFQRYSFSTVIELTAYTAIVIVLHAAEKLSVSSALLAYASSQLAALLSLAWLQMGDSRSMFSFRSIQPSVLRDCYRMGIHLFVTGIGGFGVRRINYFVIEFFGGSRDVGMFTAANAVPTILANVPQQIGMVLYSHVSAHTRASESVRLTVLVFKVLALACLLAIVAIAVSAEPIVLLLFGEAFAGIGKTMTIVSAATAATGLAALLFNALSGLGVPKYGTQMTAINLVLLTVLAFWWVPVAGIEGAAYANLVTSMFNLAFIIGAFCRNTGTTVLAVCAISRRDLVDLYNGIAGAKSR